VEDRPPDEAELVSHARVGDAQAFGELIALHQEVAFRVAFLVLGDVAESPAPGLARNAHPVTRTTAASRAMG
jgi:hypothetical protein